MTTTMTPCPECLKPQPGPHRMACRLEGVYTPVTTVDAEFPTPEPTGRESLDPDLQAAYRLLDGLKAKRRQAAPPSQADCPHLSWSGDEGPVALLGRMPRRWKCDGCGMLREEILSPADRAVIEAAEALEDAAMLGDIHDALGRLSVAVRARRAARAEGKADPSPEAPTLPRIEPRLCYVEGEGPSGTAFFTTRPLSEQWGDDWNDAPYEHNAERPYTYSDHDRKRGLAPWTITEVDFTGPFVAPCHGVINSRYSVEDINSGNVPWLTSEGRTLPVRIMAGTTLREFCAAILRAGGSVQLDSEARREFDYWWKPSPADLDLRDEGTPCTIEHDHALDGACYGCLVEEINSAHEKARREALEEAARIARKGYCLEAGCGSLGCHTALNIERAILALLSPVPSPEAQAAQKGNPA